MMSSDSGNLLSSWQLYWLSLVIACSKVIAQPQFIHICRSQAILLHHPYAELRASSTGNSGVDPNLFWGGEIFTLTGRGDKASALRPRPERIRGGWGSWEGGSEPPPHQLGGLGEHCKLPQRGPGRSPGKVDILCNLRPQNSLQKCLIMCKLLQRGCNIEGAKTKRHSRPIIFYWGGGDRPPRPPSPQDWRHWLATTECMYNTLA